MRNSMLAVVAILSFGGCSNSGSNPQQDGGLRLDGPMSVDLSGNGNPDLTPVSKIGCGDLVRCTNACTTPACNTKCHAMATTQANALNKTLDDCIRAECVQAPDGGMGPCAGADQTACNNCVSQTQSGKSPTGMTNGPNCEDAPIPPSMTGATSTAPQCGLCIDPLLACFNDLTM